VYQITSKLSSTTFYKPMFANRLVVLFAAILALGVYLTYQVDTYFFFLIIIGLVLTVTTYVLGPQINWWWWQRNPPDLPPKMAQLLAIRHPFYKRLSPTEQREFRRRMFLFIEGTNYMPKVMETVPYDGKVMLASAPVSITFREEDFLFPNFENVIVYPQPFPSPQIPESFHISEIYEPDGVMMFSMEHLIHGYVDAGQYFNPSWYEYAKVFQLSYPAYDYGDWSAVSWKNLEAISGFSEEALHKWFGLKNLDIRAMGIAFYFLFPEPFQQHLPTLFHKLETVFSHHKH
jgi:hypothetical protein